MVALSCLNAQEGMTASELATINADCDHFWVTITTLPPFDKCMKCGKSPIGVAASEQTKAQFGMHNDPIIRMSDLTEYQTECYNDSTLVQAYIPYDCNIIGCMVMHESKYVEYWIHKEPTFEGFINWLKSRQ